MVCIQPLLLKKLENIAPITKDSVMRGVPPFFAPIFSTHLVLVVSENIGGGEDRIGEFPLSFFPFPPTGGALFRQESALAQIPFSPPLSSLLLWSPLTFLASKAKPKEERTEILGEPRCHVRSREGCEGRRMEKRKSGICSKLREERRRKKKGTRMGKMMGRRRRGGEGVSTSIPLNSTSFVNSTSSLAVVV